VERRQPHVPRRSEARGIDGFAVQEAIENWLLWSPGTKNSFRLREKLTMPKGVPYAADKAVLDVG
jgi:hypothetical protein